MSKPAVATLGILQGVLAVHAEGTTEAEGTDPSPAGAREMWASLLTTDADINADDAMQNQETSLVTPDHEYLEGRLPNPHPQCPSDHIPLAARVLLD